MDINYSFVCLHKTTGQLVSKGEFVFVAVPVVGLSLSQCVIQWYISAANVPCPQPQTLEHLAVLEIMKIKHILILQNKIDLVDDSQASDHYERILASVKGRCLAIYGWCKQKPQSKDPWYAQFTFKTSHCKRKPQSKDPWYAQFTFKTSQCKRKPQSTDPWYAQFTFKTSQCKRKPQSTVS